MFFQKLLYCFYYHFYKISRATYRPPSNYFSRSGYVKSATFILSGLIMLIVFSSLKILLPKKENSTIILIASICVVLFFIIMTIFESKKIQLRYRYAYKKSGKYIMCLILTLMSIVLMAIAGHEVIELLLLNA